MGHQTAQAFFAAQAGYSYPAPADATKAQQAAARRKGRRDTGKRLAQAEAWAEAEGLIYQWVEDPDCGPDDFDLESDKDHVREHGAVGCLLYRPCPDHGTECKHAEVLASLWGITESLNNRERDNYRRVVQAELALEAMPAER